MPDPTARVALLLAGLAFAPVLSGCLADAAPAADAAPRDVPRPAALLLAQFALVARDPAAATEDALARIDAAAPPLLAAFERAADGRVRIESAGPARVLVAPPGLEALDQDAAALARAFFAAPDAPRDAHFLVLVAADVPVASDECACVAWHQRARNPSPIGPPLDLTRHYGAPAEFIGVTALGTLAELADGEEMEYRFLHETAHAWCCRVPRDAAPPGLLAERGAHWAPDVVGGDGWRDPLAGDGSERARRGVEWRYSELTLVAVGVLDARDAAGVVTRFGGTVQPLDLLTLDRA